MAMRMPIGTLVYRDIDMSNIIVGIDNLGQAFVDAGWELVGMLYEKHDLKWRGGLTDGATLTISRGATSTKYTFRNTPTLPWEIALGPTIQIQMQNCVNYLTLYDPLVDAAMGSIDGTATDRITLINLTPGVNMNISIATTDYWGNLEVYGPWMGGGYTFFSVTGPEQPLRAGIELSADGYDLRWRMCPVDFSSFSVYFFWDVVPGRMLKISIDGQQFFTWLLSSSTVQGCCAHACVPFVFEGMEPLSIATVEPNADGGSRITFANEHGMGDGQNIFIDQAISDGTYDSGLNGSWQVTIVSPTVLDLDNSVFDTLYAQGTGFGATYKRHSRLFYGIGNNAWNQNTPCFRHNIECWSGAGHGQVVCCDGSFYSYTGSYVYGTSLVTLMVLKTANTNTMCKVAAVGQLDAAMVPILAWNWPTISDPKLMMGQMPRCLVVQDDIDMDQTFVHAGHNWINYTNNDNSGALIIALTAAAPPPAPPTPPAVTGEGVSN